MRDTRRARPGLTRAPGTEQATRTCTGASRVGLPGPCIPGGLVTTPTLGSATWGAGHLCAGAALSVLGTSDQVAVCGSMSAAWCCTRAHLVPVW